MDCGATPQAVFTVEFFRLTVNVMLFSTVMMDIHIKLLFSLYLMHFDKYFSYRRETALQGGLVMAKRGSLEVGDNILQRL